MKPKVLPYIFCWRCGLRYYEWTGFKSYIINRGKCFNCRIDFLDIKYGASQHAKMVASQNKSIGRNKIPIPYSTDWCKYLDKLFRYKF